MKKEFRTSEQFEEIADNCLNGNWSDAAQNCVDYGFYANDLINKNKELELFDDLYDIAELIEIATKLRNK
jgi:hypothetical protein